MPLAIISNRDKQYPFLHKEEMMDDARTSEKVADSAKAVADDGLHTMKEAVNTAMESTQGIVQELQSDAVEAVNQTVGRTIDRVRESLDRQRPRVEHYISAHPWIVLGSLLLFWYLLPGKREPGA